MVIDKEQSFFGVHYLYEMNAIIGGSLTDNQIKFYNRHTLKEDIKFEANTGVQFRFKDLITTKDAAKNTVNLSAIYSSSKEEDNKLSNIAISENTVPFDKKFIAQGNQHGEIIIWKLSEIQKYN